MNKGFQKIWPDACISRLQTQTAAEFGMANLIDQAFGTHGTALQLRAERAQLLAANLANADTPGFKARDIDFKQALASAQGAASPLVTTQANHVAGLDVGASTMALYRTPLQPSLDGNTVDVATEQAAFGENSNRYLASLTFLNGRIRGLMTALRGE
jgi:flagellar basal-body rod protein FlgB